MSYQFRLMGLLALICIGLTAWITVLNQRLHFSCPEAPQALSAIEFSPDECGQEIEEVLRSKQRSQILIEALAVDDKFAGCYWLLFCGLGLLLSQCATVRCDLSRMGGFVIGLASATALFDLCENAMLRDILQSYPPLAMFNEFINLNALFKGIVLPDSWTYSLMLRAFERNPGLPEIKAHMQMIVLGKWVFFFATLSVLSILFLLHPRRIKRFGWIFLAASIGGLFGAASLAGYFILYDYVPQILSAAVLTAAAGIVLLAPFLLFCPQQFEYKRLKKRKKQEENANVIAAKNILHGVSVSPKGILEIAKKLKVDKQFGYARKILRRARTDPAIHDDPKLRLEIGQCQALCTYKDPDLPTDLKLQRALQILKESDDLATTCDKETLGLAGAIYKRRWEFNSNRNDLERSLAYYSRGAKVPLDEDKGWNRVNSAYLLELLAAEEKTQATLSGLSDTEVAENRLREAKTLRESLIKELQGWEDEKKDLWIHLSMAEAYLGLGNYKKALEEINNSPKDAADWERETTARQFAAIFKLHKRLAKLKEPNQTVNESEMREVLKALADDSDAVQSSMLGKTGLALSGGGFRASFYHIGVLAKLAELDVLKNIEVLSCVSGGSIIGAYYYLALKRVIETKMDCNITKEDYIEIVQGIEEKFLAGVKKNIRTRVLLNPWKTFKMMFSSYSRTERAGELMEKHLFPKAILPDDKTKRVDADAFLITNLKAIPKDGPPNFNPKINNWKRRAKLPILVLNATTLNTGHNWHFTATYMGEPPGCINSEIDANYRLRRVYYSDAPDEYQDVRLGTAVGASAAVPGVFQPVLFSDLYPDKTVLLSDGGVQDNQGIGALLEQDCINLLVSDASGQMDAIDQPESGIVNVLLRSNSILQARLRDLEFRELLARQQSSQLKNVMFIHLKKDLDSDPIDSTGSQDLYLASDSAKPASRRSKHTTYGILKDLQAALAAIRTDLDSFCEAEAYALMYSGYRMTEISLPDNLKQQENQTSSIDCNRKEKNAASGERKNWKFLDLEGPMTDSNHSAYPYLKHVLQVGSKSAFKIWHLSCFLRVFTGLFAVAALLLAGRLAIHYWETSIPFNIRIGSLVHWLLVILFLAAAGFVLDLLLGRLGRDFIKAVDIRSTIKRILFALGGAIFGWAIAGIHLLIFDRWFLKRGSVDAVLTGKYPIC